MFALLSDVKKRVFQSTYSSGGGARSGILVNKQFLSGNKFYYQGILVI